MNQDAIGLLELVVSSIGTIITLAIAGGGMLWRMHAAQNKRMDHMQRDLMHRMDTVLQNCEQVLRLG